MTQNLYDNAEFFEGYSQFDRSIRGLEGAVEWASLRTMLPDVRGSKVVDLGCGYGWFSRWAREQGAAQVLGMDLSRKMLAKAQSMTEDAAITYQQADLEDLNLPEAAYDLVYSSLALHYLENLPDLITTVHDALVPGGHFIFSVEHPTFTAPMRAEWISDPAGHKKWPLDSYLIEGPRTTDWITKGVVKQHRTTATYVNLLLRSGFILSHIEEWGPTDEQVSAQPHLAIERQRPTFLLMSAKR